MSTSTSGVSDAVYKTLVESAPDGIVIVGQEGRIVVVNSQTEKPPAMPARRWRPRRKRRHHRTF
jgi:hypothetical protein